MISLALAAGRPGPRGPSAPTRLRLPLALALALALFFAVAPARAQDIDAQKEANVHFQRAVQLYSETDYRAALVEFKRAYEISPHVTVLYNLGQTYYQLQNYAEALATFERFLADGGTAHKTEVDNAIAVLKTRVGKIDISTSTPGWEIQVDDESVGRTPLPKPISVSVGKRKITATKAGEAPITRNVEVAAGETATLALTGGARPKDTGPAADTVTAANGSRGSSRDTLVVAGWIGTGALAAGAVVTGILATGAASDLKTARSTFPGDRADIDSKASRTTTFAITTDILGAAAVILGGVTLYFTLSKPSSDVRSGQRKPPAGVQVGGGPGKLVLGATF